MLKRTISLGELITATITVLGCIISFYISTNVRLSALELKQEAAAQNHIEDAKQFEKLNLKLDALNAGQTDIKISLERKQDRK